MFLTNLKGKLVLLFVCKREALTDNISQVVLYKLHGLRETLLYLVFRCPIIVIATGQKKRSIKLTAGKHQKNTFVSSHRSETHITYTVMHNPLILSIHSLVNSNL